MPADQDPAGRPRWAGVRAGAAMVSMLVVGVVMVAGVVAFAVVARGRIESSVADAAAARVDGIVALAEAGALTDPLPGGDPELFGQVVGADGSVVAADRVIAGIGPLSVSAPPEGARTIERVESLFEELEELEERGGLEDEGPYVIVSRGVDLPQGRVIVSVAASLEDASEALGATVPLLGLGFPLLLAVVGAITWLLTGRALRPVEKMRAEAERISAEAFDRRLPVPDARDEIRRLAETLNAMLDRLESSAIRQRRFVADASHELKSPLANLRTMLEVGGVEDRETFTDAAEERLLTDLGEEVVRMGRLVDDLLYLARDDEAPAALRSLEVDLDQIAGREATSIGRRSDVRIDTTRIRPVRVLGDPDQLTRLVRNLLDNAVRYASSTVWLATLRRDGSAVLLVSDDGPGVAVDERERIFERFVRLDPSRDRDTGGAGLGLAVARAIARRHDGDIHVGEAEQGGATFSVRLPLAPT